MPALCVPAAVGTVGLEVDREQSFLAHVQATGHSFDAVVTDYELELQWDPAAREVTSVYLVFDFADVETGRETRDEEMLDWLNYEVHPLAEFLLRDLERRNGESIAHGTLTMHGNTREIQFPVQITETGDAIRITGNIQIDHRDWGLERITLFFFIRVEPVLDVNFGAIRRRPPYCRSVGRAANAVRAEDLGILPVWGADKKLFPRIARGENLRCVFRFEIHFLQGGRDCLARLNLKFVDNR